jgi:hypothetical protein
MAKISYCGQVCAECPIYQATRENDQSQRIWLALEYSSKDHQYRPEEMCCHGCQSRSAAITPMCKECDIRNCALGRVFISCAECEQYPCPTVERLVPVDTDNRAELEYRREYLVSHRYRACELLLS